MERPWKRFFESVFRDTSVGVFYMQFRLDTEDQGKGREKELCLAYLLFWGWGGEAS